MARVFDFDHAIVRQPGRSVAYGLSATPGPTPSYEGVIREHEAYVAALRDAGLTADILPPLEEFPDSVFVEDPALVFGEGAILLRPGAPSRAGEREPMRDVLARHFETVLELGAGELADGGDVMVTPDVVFIGLSARTNHGGAEALVAALAKLGKTGRVAQTPETILHFKTASSLLDEETVLVTGAMARSGIFVGFDTVIVPEDEEAAANALRVNDVVLVGDRFAKTIAMLDKAGYAVRPLPVTEIGKIDAGLSCMSLRWRGG